MRNFFSGAFKDNKNLSYGFLTGILRIAQESIFSGLNNLTVNSVMDEEYDSFFGFTESEVKAMLSYYGVSDKEEELKDWYDGYLFGSEEIYNPWSVINYISKGCLPQAYWVNTGKNEILDDVLRVATDDITERLYDLLQGERVVARIDQNVVYRSLAEDPANIYSLLLVAGYLKTPKRNCKQMVHIYVKYQFQIERLQLYIRVKSCHISCKLEQLQGLQQIRLQKVFMPMITRSCRALLGNIWINQLASSMVELKDFIMV